MTRLVLGLGVLVLGLGVLGLVLGVRYSWVPLMLLRVAWWTATKVLEILVLFAGSGTFWWVLRAYQLQHEQEILDLARLQYNYYSRYHSRLGLVDGNRATGDSRGDRVRSESGMMAASFQLRTAWSLPSEICDAIAALVELIVQNYVSFWFEDISPNEDFVKDVRFLLEELLGALAARVLEIESSQALTFAAKSLELLRLHLGWFREAYAQLADEHPDVFNGDETDSNLLQRQEYVAEFVQQSSFVHPGCVKDEVSVPSGTSSGNRMDKKNAGENAEAAYFRHVATQLLTQLHPHLGKQQDSNLFVSVAMNLLREIVGFKILKPLSEYSQPRYANEIVLSCLQAFVDEKGVTGPGLPNTSSGNVVGMVPTLTLNKLRSTSSILYKASRRSGEHAEAAFQAVVDAVASAASSAAAGAVEMVLDGDGWTDPGSNPFSFGGAVFAANSGGLSGERKAMPPLFATDERLNAVKATKVMSPLGLISGGLLSHKMAVDNSRISAHMDDLKNAKANIGCSLNSSIGKVKSRFRTLGSYQMDPMLTPPLSAGAGAAARMLRKQGQLFQKAWKRGESGASSPSSSFDDDAVTPTDRVRGLRSVRTASSLDSLVSPLRDDGEMASQTVSGTIKMAMVRDRLVRHLVKAVADYTQMYDECPEMHSSIRSRELYDLLSAMENIFMLGFRNHDAGVEGDNKVLTTAPLSPNVRRRVSIASTKDAQRYRRDSMDTDRRPSLLDVDNDDNQYYWEYLAHYRPSAELFNAHWRFVASQCPTCSPSESFVSTRGVQWMLAALVKGSLGSFCAELYAHSDVTELFYESFALLLDTTLTNSVLRTLSQLDHRKVCLDVSPILGVHKSDTDQEFSGSPPNNDRPRDLASPSLVSVLEQAWEIERYVPSTGWVKATDERWQDLPSSEWIWEDEWALEDAVHCPGAVLDSDATDSVWEYAKTVEDHYHMKQTKSDFVRRRRWVRRRCQLPPVLVLPSPMESSNDDGAVSPLASLAVANGTGMERKPNQRFNALIREKKNDNGTATTKSKLLLQSRPKSRTKEMPDSPMSDSTLGLTDPDDLQHTSAKTSAFTKARASIPSLRSGLGTRRIKSFSCDFQSLSAKAAMDDDPGSLDDNDDDSLCVRCLKALPSSALGVKTCHSCHQRVCTLCLSFHAFMVYPPPLETSRKARVCEHCYDRLVSKYKLRIEAHVGEYLTKERERELSDISSSRSAENTNTSHPLSPTSDNTISAPRLKANHLIPGAGRTSSNRFEITVKWKGDSAYAWSVMKTYRDFEMLEQQLTERLKKQEKKWGVRGQACHWKGVDYMEMTSIQLCLKTAAVGRLTYEKQLFILEQFLQQLLACDTLCQSSVVQKFLLLATASSMATGNPPISRWGASENSTSPFMPTSTGRTSTGRTSTGRVSSAEGVLHGKWQKGRWIASDANSKETKMRVLQKIEVSLFAVLGEVFEFDGIGLVRRQIFSMTRSFIKAFLGASHFRMLERQFLSFTDPKKLSGWIDDLQQHIFPTSSEADVGPSHAPEMQMLRKQCLEAILASFPSKALSLFGDTACENAALKLHEFLQHDVFVKNLLFSISDELFLHLFPNSTLFKGKQSSRETLTTPTPASPSTIQVATSIAQEAITALKQNDDASHGITSPMSSLSAPTSPPARTQRRNLRSSTKKPN